MDEPQISNKRLFASACWLAAGFGCAAFFLRPYINDLRPSSDTRVMADLFARLVAIVVCGACIGSGIGALTNRQLWFAIVGALIGPAILVFRIIQ